MSIPKFESHTSRSSNPQGETFHPESSYNLEDGDRDRKEMEDASKRNKGQEPYIPVEEIEDKSAEENIYNQAQDSIDQERENKEDIDQFGYIEMMNKIVGKLEKEDKDKFLDDSLIFLPIYHKILNNNSLSDEKKDKLLQEKFIKVFGQQISIYDVKNKAVSMSMHKNKFVKVADKAIPTDADKLKYIQKNGRPLAVDPNELTAMKKEDRIKKKTYNLAKTIFKLPFRKKNR